MELSTLSFKVETAEVKQAADDLNNLAAAMQKVNSSSAGKGLGDLGKGASTAATGLEEAAQGAERLNKPLAGDLPKNLDRVSKMIQHQSDVLKFLRNDQKYIEDGFTKSQAGMMATATAAGATSDQLQALANVFKDISKVTGKNPFDQSASGLGQLKQKAMEMSNAAEYLAKGFNLTSEQVRLLTRDQIRLSDSMKQQGSSQEAIAAALAKLEREYLQVAGSVNNYVAAAKELEKQNKLQNKQLAENITMMDTAVAQFRKLEQEKADAAARASQKIIDANQAAIDSAERLAKISKLVAGGMSQGEATKRTDMAASGVELANIEKLIAAEKQLAAAKQNVTGSSVKQSGAMSEAAKAAEWLDREIRRADNALVGFNDELKVSSSNRLFRFSEQLRKAGISGDEATAMMEKYRSTIIAGQKKTNEEMDKDLRNLARAVSVQMGDVAVSLAGGMNPFMIMIQQGDQLRAAFQLAKKDAVDTGAAMRVAAAMIAESFIDTGKNIGIFVGGVFKSLYDAVGNLGARFTGPFGGDAIRRWRTELELAEAISGKTTGALTVMNGIIAVMTTTVTAITLAFGAFSLAYGVAFFKASKEADELSKALILTGGSLGLTKNAAIDFAASFEQVGMNVSSAVQYITEFAKAGNFTKQELQLLVPVAKQMSEQLGISAEDAVKSFAKFKKEPVEALIELAKATGMVSQETLQMAIQMEDSGRKTEAQTIAMNEAARVNQVAVDRMKQDYSTLGTILVETGKAFSDLWSGIKSLIYNPNATQKLEKDIAALQERIAGRENSFGPVNKQALAADKEKLQILRDQLNYKILQEEADKDMLATQAAQARATEATRRLNKSIQDDLDKLTMKEMTRTEFVQKFIDKKLEEAKIVGNQTALNQVQMKDLEKLAELEWKKTKTAKDGAKEQLKIDNAYNAAIQRFITLREEAAGKTRELTKAEIAYNEIKASSNWDKFSSKRQEELALERDKAVNAEKLQAFQKEELRLKKELLKYEDKIYELRSALALDYEKQVESINKENDSLNLRMQVLGKTEEQTKVITREVTRQAKIRQADAEFAIEQMRIWKKFVDAQGNTEGAEFDIEGYLKAVSDADRVRKEKQLVANREVAVSAAEDFMKEFNRIQDGLSDAIVTALFEGGKAGKKKLRDVIVAELRKPITLFVNAVVKDITGGFVNSVLGNVTGSATGSAAGSAGNGMLGSLLGSGVSMSSMGSYFATGAMNTVAGTGMSAGMTAGSAVGGANGIAMQLGAAAPYIAAALALYAIYKKLDDSGTPHTGASASYSAGSGMKTGMGVYGVGSDKGFYSKDVETSMAAMSKGIVDILDQTALNFGKTAGYEAAVAFADDSSKDGAWGSLMIGKLGENLAGFGSEGNGRWPGKSFSDGEAGLKEFNAAVAADVKKALESIGLPEWATSMLDSLGDAPTVEQLGAVVDRINATQNALENLGSVMPMFASLTGEAISSLLGSFGGIENLSSVASSFYQNFYNDSEKANAATAALAKEFEKLGSPVPADRVAYRAKVQEALEAGNEDLAAKLMMLSGAFAELNPWAEATGRTAQDIAESLANMKDEGKQLAIQLLELQGKTAEANAATRLLAIEGMTELEIAAYDMNQAMKAQIADLNVRNKLEDELFKLTHSTADIRAKELATMSPANQELQKLIWSLEEAAKKTEELKVAEDKLIAQRQSLQDQLFQLTASAADKQQAILDKLADAESQRIQKQIWEVEASQKAAAEAADKKKQVESEAYNLETKRLQLLGDTKTLRERELALVDPANREAQKQIWAIEDKIEADKIAAQAAEEAARAQAQAAEEAARAAQQIKDAWKSITDSIFEEVARIRGLVAGEGPNSLAQAQSAFDSATARALNGDQEAAKSLPELSRALLDIAGEQARSMIELRRIQMLTAASLEATGTRINTNYGLAIPAYADGGNYAGGVALVGENGPELINFNSSGRVYDAKTTAGMLGSGSNLEALVEKLNANIEGLRYEVRAGVTHTSKVAKILERVTPDGDAVATRTVV